MHTFSAGFGRSRPRTTSCRTRELVSEHLGTDHHEVKVGPGDFVAHWEKLTWHRDAPLSEPADVAVYPLARARPRST